MQNISSTIKGFSVPPEVVMTWPNTPGLTSFNRAVKAHSELYTSTPWEHSHLTLEDFRLAEQYDLLINTEDFRRKAADRFSTAARTIPPERYIPLLLQITTEAASDDTIGLAIATKSPKGKGFYTFTQLLKHPHWMGMDPALPKLKGLRAVVFDLNTPSSPAFILALPPNDISVKEHKPFPQGQASILRDLLAWHGATPAWSPISLT